METIVGIITLGVLFLALIIFLIVLAVKGEI
jgi:hypothetical protein